jgi:hypothetical protein
LKDDGKSFAYKNILLNKKFEDDKEESRSFLGIGSDGTKSYFVALYSSTNPEVLPPPKSSTFNKFIKLSKTPQASLFSGGSDSDSNDPPKEVQTKFRVSRRKSRKSKK